VGEDGGGIGRREGRRSSVTPSKNGKIERKTKMMQDEVKDQQKP
jgi:hypothetical protein